MLFNFALDFAIRRVQVNQDGLKLNGTHQLLVYAGDVNVLGGSVLTIEKNTEALVVASKGTELEVNADETKYMVNPNKGHSSILKRLQQSDPIFNMGVDDMRPAFNLEPKYRVTMLIREDWTGGSGSPPGIKGLIWFTNGSKMKEVTGAGIFGQSVKRRLSFSLGRYTTVFQAEIYAILACVHEIQFQKRPEKYISICSDSQASLKALQAVRMTSPLVHQCQKALNDISAWHVVGLYWVPGHAGVRGNEVADGLARGGSALGFPGPEPALGISRRDKEKVQSMVN